jgi:transcriptional regulator with XRE-family HTH domain
MQGKRLAAIRDFRRMTQRELAAACGVSLSLIGSWELGRTTPPRRRLEALARALHCKPGDLLAPVHTPLPLVIFRGGPSDGSDRGITFWPGRQKTEDD